jgi:hypothetical protein
MILGPADSDSDSDLWQSGDDGPFKMTGHRDAGPGIQVKFEF